MLSNMSDAITGQVIYADSGYNIERNLTFFNHLEYTILGDFL